MDASIRPIELVEQQSKEAPRSTKNSQKSGRSMLCLSHLLLLSTRLSQLAVFSFGMIRSISNQESDSFMSQKLEPTGGSMLRLERTREANAIMCTKEKRRIRMHGDTGSKLWSAVEH